MKDIIPPNYPRPERDKFPRCEFTGKVKYPSEKTAKAAMRSLLKHKSANTSKLRAYKCENCHCYHLSSSINKKPNKKKPNEKKQPYTSEMEQ